MTVGSGGSNVSIGLQATNGSCGSAGSVGVTISGGQPNYTVSWSGAASGSASAAGSYNIPNLPAGTYTVTVADFNGCSASQVVTVGNGGSAVSASLQASAGACGAAGSVGVVISGGSPTYTISWTGPSNGTEFTTNNSFTAVSYTHLTLPTILLV